MNTINLMIKAAEFREFCADVKRMNVKHGPFNKSPAGYRIEILKPETAHTFFLLKYGR